MMTLDEAILHAEEIAEEKENFIKRAYETLAEDRFLFAEEENECKKCAEEHRQLAEWLKDYKRLLEQEPCEDCIARQPKIGRWIKVHPLQADDEGAYMCSCCEIGDWDLKGTENFCPNCGAKMEM